MVSKPNMYHDYYSWWAFSTANKQSDIALTPFRLKSLLTWLCVKNRLTLTQQSYRQRLFYDVMFDIMAWYSKGYTPLPEPMMTQLDDTYVTML